MKAIILCAGFATRMFPLTKNFPKPLLKVAGKPILSDLVEQLIRDGEIGELIVVSNDRFHQHFVEWADSEMERHQELAIRILNDGATENENRLGAVRDLELAVRTLDTSEPVLVAGGDNLFRFEMSKLFEDHRKNPRNLICVYREDVLEKLERSGVAVVDMSDRVIEMLEKPENPPSQFACPPLYILHKTALARLPAFIEKNPTADAPGNFIAWLVDREPVYAHVMDGGRLDIGNIETYHNAEALLKGMKKGH